MNIFQERNIFQNRRAVRDYLKKPISDEQIQEILKTAMYAPSGYNKHPLEFVIIKNETIKEKLALTNQWSSYANKAAALIVICADADQSMVWLEDASIAIGYMWLKATQLNLGACWVHIKDSKRLNGDGGENYVRKILNIPWNFRVVCFLTLGYPAASTPKHHEDEYRAEKIHYEQW